MKNFNIYLVAIVYLAVFLFCNSNQSIAQSKNKQAIQAELDSLDLKLKTVKAETLIPGFAVTILHENSVIFSKGYGKSDVFNSYNFTPETTHIIASISKTFIGIAIMKLVEQGELQLDDNVNDILPFEIVSPHFPDTPITVRHLVTHTSSLNDDFDDGEKRPSQLLEKSRYAQDEIPESLAEDIYYYDGFQLDLEEYMKEVFTPEGKWYNDSNFSNFKPGDKYEYSNEGADLAALIVEVVAGIPFSEFCQENIFQPLQMNNTSWFYRDLDSTYSKLYVTETENEVEKLYEFPRSVESNYPCGDLKSNMIDLSKYVIEIRNGYNGEGKILNADSYKTLLTPQLDRDKIEGSDDESSLNDEYDVGVFWAISKPGLILHKGGSIGVFSILYFNPENNIGVIAYCNLADGDFGKIVNLAREYELKFGQILKE